MVVSQSSRGVFLKNKREMMKVGTITNLSQVCTAWSEQQSIFVWSLSLFNQIVVRPMCDSEWSLLCHSILAFCFTSLFLLCKNMTYFSLCTAYFV